MSNLEIFFLCLSSFGSGGIVMGLCAIRKLKRIQNDIRKY